MKRASEAGIGAVSAGTLIVFAATCLTGCSSWPQIQLVGSDSSTGFDMLSGDTEIISYGTPGQKQYRVLNYAGNIFLPVAPVLADAEQAASVFCDRKGKVMNPLQITTFKPPLIPLWGLPTAEMFFECVEEPNASGSPAAVDPR